MRRRLTVAMILMVLGSLVLSGLVSLALAVHSTKSRTRNELVREAQGLAVERSTAGGLGEPFRPGEVVARRCCSP